MVFGPKTEIVLQRPVETTGSGTVTGVTWPDVETISKAVIRPFTTMEKQVYGRDAVVEMKKVYIGYDDIASTSRVYLTEKSRIQIDSTNYDIESVELFEGPGQHYKLILRRVK